MEEEERWAARLYETASRREWRRDRLYAPFHLLFLAPGTLKAIYRPGIYFKGPDLAASLSVYQCGLTIGLLDHFIEFLKITHQYFNFIYRTSV